MGLLSDLFGKKPKVPSFNEIIPEEQQKKAIAGNIAALPGAQDLASKVDLFNQDQLEKMLERSLPGASGQIRSNISKMLAGELPEGVLSNLRQSAAERGVSQGTIGSGFQLGRELGSQLRLSLQLTEAGLDSATRWLQVSSAPLFDVTSTFFSPQERVNIATNERNSRMQRDWLAAKIEASPDPVARGIFDTTMEVIGMALSAYGGGEGYKGHAKPVDEGGFGGGGGGSSSTWRVGGGGFGIGTTKSSGGDRQWFLGSQTGPG